MSVSVFEFHSVDRDACPVRRGKVMNRKILFSVLTAISLLVLQPLAVCAQGKTANLVVTQGYGLLGKMVFLC